MDPTGTDQRKKQAPTYFLVLIKTEVLSLVNPNLLEDPKRKGRKFRIHYGILETCMVPFLSRNGFVS